MTDWNYGDVWETVADTQPELVAMTQGARNVTWSEFDRGADGFARFLLDLGVVQQDKVALYLYNVPEYLQATFAAAKIGLVPVNTNYRYGDDELAYLWDNADAVAVVFHGSFSERVERVFDRVPRVKGWLWVDDGAGPCPDWATPYEDAAKSADGRVSASWGRSGDDLFMLYTGGTTGMPKGVMWRQDDLFTLLLSGSSRRYDPDGGLDGVRQVLSEKPGSVTLLPACPLMHGTGAFTAYTVLADGGTGVPAREPALRPRRDARRDRAGEGQRTRHRGRSLLAAAAGRAGRASGQVGPELAGHDHLVGGDVERAGEGTAAGPPSTDAAGRRLQLVGGARDGAVDLGRRHRRQDRVVHARPQRQGPRRIGPRGGAGLGRGGRARPGRAQPARLLQGRGQVRSARSRRSTASATPSPATTRRSTPTAPSTCSGAGRSSSTRAARRSSPRRSKRPSRRTSAVRDAVVVGVPDPVYGEQVVAAVELVDGEPAQDEAELIAHVKERLASYKAPRRVRIVSTIGRAPNGKVDYKRHRAESMEELGVAAE